MTGQINFFSSSFEFTPTNDLAQLLISLLDLSLPSKLLVIEFGDQISRLADSYGYDVVQLRSQDKLENQIHEIDGNGPYDGAIILSTFSDTSAYIEPPKGWELKKTFTEDWLIASAINNLQSDGRLTALVPNGLLSNYGRRGLRQGLIERGLKLVATLPQDMLYREYKLASTGLILLNRENIDPSRYISFVDCIFRSSLPKIDFWKDAIAGTAINDVVKIQASELEKEDFRLDPQYYDPAYLQIKAPPGYVEVSLGEIAEIRGGTSVNKNNRFDTKPSSTSIPYLQVRHILNNGEIADKVFWVEPSEIPDIEARLARPGDILITVAGTVGKVARVSGAFEEGVLFDTSIRRVRVSPNYVDWVFQFFQSEIGKLQFRRMTGGTAIPQITTPILETMRIFLPTSYEDITNAPIDEPKTTDITAPETQANLIAGAIQEKVVDYLRNVKPDDMEWKGNIDKTLRGFLEGLIPKPLETVILEEFPTPIAIPYRRFQMARYNPYERLDRMVSLVESCVYFVFHVLIADYCRQGWHDHITLCKEAKQALKGTQSIDYRLKFINDVLGTAHSGSISLFMPDLVNTCIVQVVDQFRDEVRNPISHSAPGSEPYIRSLIDGYWPLVKELLESLQFLESYSLCRIRDHYFQNGEWRYQAEIYRGAEYDVNIQEYSVTETSVEGQLIDAERDHLVLLDPDGETLDLFPFYQMYFGDETCRESHLCFYKYRKGTRLVGESIRSSFEVTLLGMEDFHRLTRVNIGDNNQEP